MSYKHSQETKDKIRKALEGKKRKPHSEETKQKMREAAIKRNKNKEYIQKLKKSHSSIKDPEKWKELCKANSKRMKDDNPMKNLEVAKKMGETQVRRNRRKQSKTSYRFRYDILKRDKYCCMECGITNQMCNKVYDCDLDVHHIDYNANNNTSSNGISLCHGCHSRTTRNKKFFYGYYYSKIRSIYKHL